MDNETFLQEQQDQMSGMLRPYQSELRRRERLADFVNKCIRSAGRDDFFQLDELLNSRMAAEVEAEAGYEGIREVFERLRQDTAEKVDHYRVQFLGDFTRLVEEAELPLENDFPRLTLLKGMDLEIKFNEKHAVLNGKVLKTVDPQRIMRAVLRLKRRLYDRTFNPQDFIDRLYAACERVVAVEGGHIGSGASLPLVYREYTWSLQAQSFFQNMAKGRFREYDADQLAVDFWRYFSSDVTSTSEGYVPRLSTGRGAGMWVVDQLGEKRRYSLLSFHDREDS
ncbi:hypothetical protein [Candidatus Entotheonella palauensis]|uniref:Uncharacterized protein n=1 Tax=Candidatus Entotheonella gemina TaxID=1429439 RepID=W4ME97_9BACT|nr:hypothetical protein [Candidatus Entotheonella palauensis]ETX08543.1 MAG: hypothetical protein ETSY2_04790 [Candidatus Entotheonella gemina]